MRYTEKSIRKLVDDIDKYNYIESAYAERRFDECNRKLNEIGIDKGILKRFDDALCLDDADAGKNAAVEQAKQAIVKAAVAKLGLAR